MSSELGDRTAETTVDHEEIKVWVEQRDGTPARITEGGNRSTRLRIAFPADEAADTGGSTPSLDDEALEEISWARFFELFEAENLAFRYREPKGGDERRRGYEFVDRNAVGVDESDATDELVGDTVTSRTATGVVDVEPGMDVVDVSDGKLGIVSQVSGAQLYVEPDPGLTDKLKIELGRGDADENEELYEVSENQIERIADGEVRVYRSE